MRGRQTTTTPVAYFDIGRTIEVAEQMISKPKYNTDVKDWTVILGFAKRIRDRD